MAKASKSKARGPGPVVWCLLLQCLSVSKTAEQKQKQKTAENKQTNQARLE